VGNDTPTSEEGKGFLPEGEGFFGDSYAGDVSPREAWEILKTEPKAVLVDVRTLPEWQFVGVPDLSGLGKEVVLISWRMYPSMAVNGGFCNQLGSAVVEADSPLFFICRSGHRSVDAAIEATRYGFKHCYNIAGGFEGDVDEYGHRARKNGWKLNNLPWGQK
jgi:rhodanese-related sulfurtransferase